MKNCNLGFGRRIVVFTIPLMLAQQTAASRADVEVFLKKTGAQLWIEHDIKANANLKKAPQYYE